MREIKNIILDGLWKNNSSFMRLLGFCPLIAVSNTASSGLALGFVTTLVLTCTNTVISTLRHWIPKEIRIPIYLMVITSILSTIQLLIQAYAFDIYQSLGIFIPLIVTNCIIINRAEIYASQRPPLLSALDGFFIGLGSTYTLLLLSAMRELVGNGTIFDGADQVLGKWAHVLRFETFQTDTPFLLAIFPPGAFISLGFILFVKNFTDQYIKASKPKSLRSAVL